MNQKRKQFLLEFLRVIIVVLIALAIGFAITAMVSDDPVDAYKELLTGPLPKITITDEGVQLKAINRFGNWIEDSITLILVGLSVALVFSARQFSLGAEGQIYMGALAAGIVSLFIQAPLAVHIGLVLIVAGAAGFLWGLVPGVLKAYLNADEIVSTLMLNVIALQFYNLLLTQWLKDPEAGFVGTKRFPETAQFPVVIPDTRVTIALFVVIVAVVAVWFLMTRTPLGYEIKAIGANLKFAQYGGINTKKTIALSFAVSGILAGLAGAHLANGLVKQLTLGISVGVGWEGIVVALLARNDAKFVPIAGLFYGYLRTGAQIMERSSDVTREVVLIIQAIIILFITAERVLPLIQQWWRRRHLETVLPPSSPPTGGGNIKGGGEVPDVV